MSASIVLFLHKISSFNWLVSRYEAYLNFGLFWIYDGTLICSRLRKSLRGIALEFGCFLPDNFAYDNYLDETHWLFYPSTILIRLFCKLILGETADEEIS